MEFHGEGMAAGRVIGFLDELWRWGTAMNPDRAVLEDPTVPLSVDEKRAASGLASMGSVRRRA